MLAAPVGVADTVQHLDQVLDDHRHLFWRLAVGLGQRRRGLNQPQRERLFSAATLDHAELDLLAGLQRAHASRECRGANVHIAPVILGQKAEALFGVVKPHPAYRHVTVLARPIANRRQAYLFRRTRKLRWSPWRRGRTDRSMRRWRARMHSPSPRSHRCPPDPPTSNLRPPHRRSGPLSPTRGIRSHRWRAWYHQSRLHVTPPNPSTS